MADQHIGPKAETAPAASKGATADVAAQVGGEIHANPLEMDWWQVKAREVLGDWGLAILFLAVAVFAIWWHWDKIRKQPGVARLLSAVSRKRLHTADKERFTVGVAHLEKDRDGEVEGLVVKALHELEGVQVVRFDRTISVEGYVPEESERAGHERARGYLEKTGADVLIWGRIWRHEGKCLPQLYWTSSHAGERKPGDYRPTEDLKMPPVFWDDLADVLGLLAVSRYADLYGEGGRYVADRLVPFISKVRRLLAASAGKSEWNADARASTLVVLANALSVLGAQTGENTPLKEAVAAYRAALEERTRERVPLDWAATQNNLGNALTSLGERESGTGRLEEAVAAYRAALEERTRQRVPLDWAATQTNLGGALQRLGERESGTGHLEEAVAAYRAALQERTPELVPLQWATTKIGFGLSLWRLGERMGNVDLVVQARQSVEAAYRLYTEAGYDQYREDFETRLRDIDASIAKLKNADRSSGVE